MHKKEYPSKIKSFKHIKVVISIQLSKTFHIGGMALQNSAPHKCWKIFLLQYSENCRNDDNNEDLMS